MTIDPKRLEEWKRVDAKWARCAERDPECSQARSLDTFNEFGAMASEAIPALIAEVERLRGVEDRLRQASRDYMRLRESSPPDVQSQAVLLGQRDEAWADAKRLRVLLREVEWSGLIERSAA